MNEYDVLLVLITVCGFVISGASVGVRFTRAIGQVKAATEAIPRCFRCFLQRCLP